MILHHAFAMIFAVALWGSGDSRIQSLLDEGAQLNDEQALKLVARLQASPADVDARIKLLSHYRSRRPKLGVSLTHQVRLQILGLIEHAPRSAIHQHDAAQLDPRLDWEGFIAAKAAWTHWIEAHPKDPDLLFNSLRSLSKEDSAQFKVMVDRGKELEPRQHRWFELAADQFYFRSRLIREDCLRKKWSNAAVTEYQQAIKLIDSEDDHIIELLVKLDIAATAGQRLDIAAWATDRLASEVQRRRGPDTK